MSHSIKKECAGEHVLTTAARRFGFDLNIVPPSGIDKGSGLYVLS